MQRVIPKIFREEHGAGEEKGEYARMVSNPSSSTAQHRQRTNKGHDCTIRQGTHEGQAIRTQNRRAKRRGAWCAEAVVADCRLALVLSCACVA
jgi:hypothetical protein